MISLVTNIDSLVAQQNLATNSAFQSNTIQQLTSGYRINSSADDAAGLSVANGYRDQIAELNQGVLNANDGVSQLQIMDGGLSNISQMLDRLQTLATESASQTFTGNRQTVQNEYSSLLTEIDRQANNIGLGDQNTANAQDLQVYIGGGQSSDANSSVGVNLSNQSVSATGLGLAGTSVLSTAAVSLGAAAAATPIQAGDSDTFTINNATGTTSFTITGQTNDTLQTQLNEINAQLQATGVTASLNSSGYLQLQSSQAFSASAVANDAADLVDSTADTINNTGLNSQSYQEVSGKDDTLTFTVGSSSTTYNIVGGAAATQTQVDAINQQLQSAGITGVTAVLDATDSTGESISFQGAASFTVSAAETGGGAAGGVLGDPSTAAAGGDPNAAINAITQAVQSLGTVQGIVGAGENTLNYAINLAQSQITSFTSAESQIRDANVAQEAANLSQAQVMQQASIAAMAQANQEPQAILALLKQ